MRMAPTLVLLGTAGIAMLAPGGAVAPSSAAARPGLRSCVDTQQQVKKSSLLVTHIRTNYPCSYARRKLRALLRRGVDAIPESKAHSGRWGCSAGPSWTCRKYPRHGKPSKRIRFRLTVQRSSGSGPPPNPAANPLQACVDLWNGDAANRALIGYHFYYHHGIRRLWVYKLPSGRCAFIGVVPTSDLEYGNDGEVSVAGGGWAFMSDVPELGDPKAVQAQAVPNANATIGASGAVTLG